MSTKAYSMTPDGAKAVNINRLPAEAWTYLQGGDPNDAGLNLEALYERVPWLNRGVDIIAEAVQRMPREFHSARTGDILDKPPVLKLEIDMDRIANELAGDYILQGAAYAVIERNDYGVAKRVRRLLPASVKPKYSETDGLVGFERTVNGKTIPLELKDVCYIWTPNRRGEAGPGKSRAYAAFRAASFLDNIDLFGKKFFEQGTMRPNLIFVDGSPSDAEVQRMQSFFERMASGVKNAWKTLAVRQKVESITFGETPDKLEMPGLTDKKREDVATALGVPQSLLFSNATNFATAQQDDLHFYDKTVNPLAELIFAKLSEFVFEPFGYELRPHPEDLEIYQRIESEKADALSVMHDRHVITTNEFRDSMGWEQVDGLDEAENDLLGWPAARTGATPTPELTPGQTDANAPDPAIAELQKMRRWLEKRISSGKAFEREFETRYLNRTLKRALEGALAAAETADERKAIFADAERWVKYP